ncbi:MAG: ABC transporter permease [Acidobacteriia bacterium]|nr:ABC transporter permease [Terriglobia bacterium]
MVFRSTRILLKHWKLTAIAVFSLSIAMALGVISLSVSNTFLLLPPAAPEPDRLVKIYTRTPAEAIGAVSYPDYKYYRENNHVFTDIAAAPNTIQVNTTFDGDREIKVVARPVSENYFAVMGLRPYLGRLFAPGDDSVAKPVAVMTYSCWKRMGGDPNISGKEIAGFTIVGVAPREFTGSFFGFNGDLLTSLPRSDPAFTKRDNRGLILVARLKPGVSRGQAQADMAALSGQLASAFPKEDKDVAAVVTRATLAPPSDPGVELGFAILMGFVLLVLLVACANVANLLLAVAVGKRQEAAIKLAVGASRGRLIREFLSESALICGASAALGYAAAAALIARFSNFSFDLPMLGTYSLELTLRLDATVAGLTVSLMLLAILATGLPPALYASRPDLAQVLGGEIVVGGTHKNVRRSALVIVQVAVCTLVLVGMGLCQRSLYNLRHTDPGFSQRNLVAVTIYAQDDKATEAAGREAQGNVRRAVASLAGVESVTLTSSLPLALGYNEVPVKLPQGDKKTPVGQAAVDGDYFSTFGIRILNGRVFKSGDRENAPDVVVINRKMADTLWPGQDPVGRTLLTGDTPRKATVIGVAADGKYESFDEPARAVMYVALSQHYQQSVVVVARTKGDPRLWIEPLNQAVQGLGIVLPFRPVTFDTWTNFTLLAERITAVSVAGLTALGMLLAIVGLFGAISYSVSERKKELGIRVALGARPGQLLKMVLRETLSVTGAGIAIGILFGVGATVLLRSQFYGVSAVEWTVLVPVAAAMLAISALVAYLCARSWITIDPMEAVRHA